VTRMIFAGETVEEGKLGTVGPLTKDLSRFRPITLLEPIYKCCMGTVAKRTAVLLHKYGRLNMEQFGFVSEGSCLEPMFLFDALITEAEEETVEGHSGCVDASGAFDSVPHVPLDAAWARVGADEATITWWRSCLSEHARLVSTAYGVESVAEKRQTAAGCPQGCPSSPIVWVVVADVALCFARGKGGKGFSIHGAVVRSLAFADDMSGHDNTKGDLELTLQALLLTLGAIFGVRFNAAKSFYLHSRNAEGGSLELCMLDSNGRWSKQEVLAAKPDKEAWGHDGQGSSGGGRYLGPWFGYVTCPGADKWIVHRIALKRLTDGFVGRVRAQRPTVPQLYEAVQGVLLGAHMYSWQVVTPTEEELTALRASM
jgi:hypothetical protein